MPNVTVSVANSESCAMPSFSTNNADPPKTAKKIKVTSVGATRTPVINWLIVLPFHTLAINLPTNGPQEIHHAHYNKLQSLIQPRLSALLGLSSKLISKKLPTYLPIEVVNISNIYTDGPTINRVSTNAAAIHIFVVLRILIPFPSPDQADKMN